MSQLKTIENLILEHFFDMIRSSAVRTFFLLFSIWSFFEILAVKSVCFCHYLFLLFLFQVLNIRILFHNDLYSFFTVNLFCDYRLIGLGMAQSVFHKDFIYSSFSSLFCFFIKLVFVFICIFHLFPIMPFCLNLFISILSHPFHLFFITQTIYVY